MDKYDAANDHYCYPNTNVLQNRLGIKDAHNFELAERDITNITINRVIYRPPPYDLNNFKTIHRELFSDLYTWAGEIRDVNIAKGGTVFCIHNRIDIEIGKLFRQLAQENWLVNLKRNELCQKLAEYYCEFNMIHPFREGNGRVQRIFFEHLTLNAGYELDWSKINPHEWIQANIDGVNVDYRAMEIIFRRILIP